MFEPNLLRRSFPKLVSSSLAVFAGIIATNTTQAGGYLSAVNGQPAAWANASVVVNLDQGELGRLSNAEANAFVLAALEGWENSVLPTSALDISTGAVLPEDINGENSQNFYNNQQDSFNPVIYDDNGSVTAILTGEGNQDFVIGFALPAGITSDGVITDGSIVMNGLFLDGGGNADLTDSEFQGAIRHEFGHLLNLNHAQFNDSFANDENYANYPTMYPSVHPDVLSLAPDDIAWISDIYPASTFTTTSRFSGTVRNRFPNAAPITGVNVVARLISDPTYAISCVTGFNGEAGFYRIPGILPGQDYVIDIEPIRLQFSGGSSVGPLEVPLDLFLNGVPEFLNDDAFESIGDSVLVSTTFQGGAANTTTALPDLRLNGQPNTFLVDESENGGNFPEDAQVFTPTPGILTRISGRVESGETGTFTFNTNPTLTDEFEDIYAVRFGSGIELQRVTLSPNTDMDLILADENGNILASSTRRGSVEEVIDSFISTNLTDGELIYILISNFPGELPGEYILEVLTSVSDSDFVAVTDVIGQVPGTVRILGTGFNDFQPQIIQFSDPDIVANNVQFVSENEITADIRLTGGFENPVTIQVDNFIFAGGFGGRLTTDLSRSPEPDAWVFY